MTELETMQRAKMYLDHLMDILREEQQRNR